jgi:hypothetical protein
VDYDAPELPQSPEFPQSLAGAVHHEALRHHSTHWHQQCSARSRRPGATGKHGPGRSAGAQLATMCTCQVRPHVVATSTCRPALVSRIEYSAGDPFSVTE